MLSLQFTVMVKLTHCKGKPFKVLFLPSGPGVSWCPPSLAFIMCVLSAKPFIFTVCDFLRGEVCFHLSV